jgi:hypothetical protein
VPGVFDHEDNDPEGSIPHAPKAKVLTTVDVNDVGDKLMTICTRIYPNLLWYNLNISEYFGGQRKFEQ